MGMDKQVLAFMIMTMLFLAVVVERCAAVLQ